MERKDEIDYLEMWEYVIKPALEYDGTIEELGYYALETPHGTIYLSNDGQVR